MAYNLLKGKKGIIFGALDNKSIAWKIAEKAHEEGAIFTLSNTLPAVRFGQIDENIPTPGFARSLHLQLCHRLAGKLLDHILWMPLKQSIKCLRRQFGQ